MPDGIGYRYQPGANEALLQRGGNGGSPTTAPQTAIRTLSLRVPQTQSVPGLSPLPLLNATGGGGSDLDMLLAALLKAFGGGGGMGQGPSRPNAQGAPPRIIPGIDDPTEDRGPLSPVNLEEILRGKSGGNTGIGNTGRGPMGPLGPAPGGMPWDERSGNPAAPGNELPMAGGLPASFRNIPGIQPLF
jgi:hypothetical protein